MNDYNCIKFEFPDRKNPLYLQINTPVRGDSIKIRNENDIVIAEYVVDDISYNFREVNGMLFGSGDITYCVKLVNKS